MVSNTVLVSGQQSYGLSVQSIIQSLVLNNISQTKEGKQQVNSNGRSRITDEAHGLGTSHFTSF